MQAEVLRFHDAQVSITSFATVYTSHVTPHTSRIHHFTYFLSQVNFTLAAEAFASALGKSNKE
jgi:hypothetical protein